MSTRRPANAGIMLAHRLRRWASIKPAVDQRIMFCKIGVGVVNRSGGHLVGVPGDTTPALPRGRTRYIPRNRPLLFTQCRRFHRVNRPLIENGPRHVLDKFEEADRSLALWCALFGLELYPRAQKTASRRQANSLYLNSAPGGMPFCCMPCWRLPASILSVSSDPFEHGVIVGRGRPIYWRGSFTCSV